MGKDFYYKVNRSQMKKSIALLAFLILFFTVGAQEKKAIQHILDQQVRCWNKGDLNCFMKGYWQADSLKYINKNGIIYGYEAILTRYKKSYPDKAQMGTLQFDIMVMEQISEDYYFVVGKYHLTREIGDKEGHFTLLWKKINGQWVIISDHSS